MNRYRCGCRAPGGLILPSCPLHGCALEGLEKVSLRGYFRAEVWEKGRFLKDIPFANTVLTAGITHMLGVQFAAGTQVTSWYFGPIDNTSFSAIAAGDTAASHAGWIESTAYAEASRQAWSPVVASAIASNAAAPAVVTANAACTIKGAFIATSATKGSSSGTLWSAGAFASSQVLAAGQALRLTYTLTGA